MFINSIYFRIHLECLVFFSTLAWNLPKEIEGKPISVVGKIASLPIQQNEESEFIFRLKKMIIDEKTIPVNQYICLTWRHPATIKPGDKWQVRSTLVYLSSYVI